MKGAKTVERGRKPLGFSKTVAIPEEAPRGRPRRVQAPGRPSPAAAPRRSPEVIASPRRLTPSSKSDQREGGHRIRPLVEEWLMELRVMGRSPRTIAWYRQKFDWYRLQEGAPVELQNLNGYELKRVLAGLQERGLKPTTVHGFFETIRAFGNWAHREGYPVDASLLRVRPPSVPITELETYSKSQVEAILTTAPAGWARLAVQILLGTGMRVGELAGLELDDFEDEGEASFLKIKRGKGAKFRRVPVSERLRREIVRYINRQRPETASAQLLLRADGQRVGTMTVEYLLRRVRLRVGFRVHAHAFRHTFATEYLRNGGEIERLRRILGHSSYVMVMRYLHLDKGDLGLEFDARTPF
jgi:site-specific recombinase XerD